MATREHIDFCFMVTEAGGTIYSDRTAVITTDTVGIAANKTGLMEWFGESQLPDFKLYDLPYFMLRWSDAWDLASLHHLRQKWNLAEDKYFKKTLCRTGRSSPRAAGVSVGQLADLWARERSPRKMDFWMGA